MAGSCGQRAEGAGGACRSRSWEPRGQCGALAPLVPRAHAGLQVPADPVLTEGTGTTEEDPEPESWEMA